MQCKVNNCPLGVDFVTDWNPDKTPKWGLCWYHRHSKAVEWTATTNLINQNLTVIVAIRAIMKINDPVFMPRLFENVSTWRERCESNLNRIIFNKKSDDEQAEIYEKLRELQNRLLKNDG